MFDPTFAGIGSPKHVKQAEKLKKQIAALKKELAQIIGKPNAQKP
jgi:hypothetical protein